MNTKLFIALMITVVSFETHGQGESLITSPQYDISKISLQNNGVKASTNGWIRRLNYSWIGFSGQEEWGITDGVERTFSPTNLLLHEINKDRDQSTSVWRNTKKIEYHYLPNKKVNEMYSYSWTGSSWDQDVKWVGSYTSFDSIQSVIQYSDDQGTWNQEGKTDYTYDGNKFMIEVNGKSWDIQNSKWDDDYSLILKNNSQGYPIEILGIICVIGPCDTAIRLTYNWDINNNLSQLTEEDFNAGNWLVSSQTKFLYDSNNKLISEVEESEDGGTWTVTSSITYAYNSDGTIHEELTQVIDGTSLVNATKSVYGYKEFPLSEKAESKHSKIEIYPNPTTGILNLFFDKQELQQIEIVNIAGEKVHSETVVARQYQVDINHLNAGIYFVNISNDSDEIVVRKIVKQ